MGAILREGRGLAAKLQVTHALPLAALAPSNVYDNLSLGLVL